MNIFICFAYMGGGLFICFRFCIESINNNNMNDLHWKSSASWLTPNILGNYMYLIYT